MCKLIIIALFVSVCLNFYWANRAAILERQLKRLLFWCDASEAGEKPTIVREIEEETGVKSEYKR